MYMTTTRTRLSLWSVAGAAALLLTACGGGGGGAAATGDGSLRVALTDAPSCGFDHVYVTVNSVRAHKSATASDTDGGWADIILAAPRRIDLLSLTNGVLEELGTTPLASGHYSQLRLVLATNASSGAGAMANAVQPTGGAEAALSTPSAQQSGLKLQANFDVAAGQMADLVLDFDACKSVVTAGNSGNYILKPVVSVTPRVASSIQGYVTTTLALSATTISAQQNGIAVRSTTPDSTGRFSIPYLAAGTYTLVLTSDARATGVVTSVPTGTGTTTINGTTTAIVLPAASMADVTGTVVASTGTGTATVSTPITDATVRATQALTGGPAIEVRSSPVDALLGTYKLRLPTAAPVKAAYSATALVFAPDTPVAGKYSVEVTAPGRATTTKPADISSGTSAVVQFTY